MKYKVTLTILMSSDLKFPHHSINQNFKFHVAASLMIEKGERYMYKNFNKANAKHGIP